MVNKSASLSQEVFDDIEKNFRIKNFSEWVEKRYREEFMNLEKEEARLRELEEEIKKTKDKIAKLKSVKEKPLISDEAYRWIKEVGIMRLRKYHINGVLTAFNTDFHADLSMSQFRKIVEKAKEEVA